MNIALVRGKFLNKYEMQTFEPLAEQYNFTAIGSMMPFHEQFIFPTVKLLSPVDTINFPYKMQILNRIFVDANYLFGLESVLKGFDIVHTAETYFHYTHQCLLAKRKGIIKKVIATELENIPFNNEGLRGRSTFKKTARAELDHIIAISHQARDTLIIEGMDPRKISVVGYGINIKQFKPKKHVRKKNHIKILFVGRIEWNKGIYDILYAAKLLLTDHELSNFHIEFRCIGKGSQLEKVIIKERQLGIKSYFMHTTVAYSKLPLEYNEADIFIAPSKEDRYWQEQYGIALLEAQASGLPIVTTQSGSIPENVGDAALLIQPGDFISLYRAIKTLITSTRLRTIYAEKARKRAEIVHNSLVISSKIKSIYEKVITQ